MADEKPRKMRRVRRLVTAPKEKAPDKPEEPKGGRPQRGRRPEGKPSWKLGEAPPEEEGPDGYKYVRVPPMEGAQVRDASFDSVREQVGELYEDFVHVVANSEDSFRQFMLWANETEGVNFQDLLIATRTVYDIMGTPIPGDRAMWAELRDLANLVEVTPVSDSELEYALEVFSKTFDLYKDELRRLEGERAEAESRKGQRISEEILAEDEGLLEGRAPPPPGTAAERAQPEAWEEAAAPEVAPEARTEAKAVPALKEKAPPETVSRPAEALTEAERWEKIVDDTRSKINSTKSEVDELIEELAPSKAERDAAISRLRVLERDANRKRARLEWFQRGRISEAKADEIASIEREISVIEAESGDWSNRLGSAQRHIDSRIDACRDKRSEFDRIRSEVEAVIAGLPSEDRKGMYAALEGEMQDLQAITRDVDRWIQELQVETSTVQSVTAPRVPPRPAVQATAGSTSTTPAAIPAPPADGVEPPVVFRDEQVREMLSKVIERPPEEELTLRIESLQKELINRENRILELENAIEKLIEEKQGSPTAVDLERNKMRLELARTHEQLGEKQKLLEQYLEVIRSLENQMAKKDHELKETLDLNRRKTDELRAKEEALKSTERELMEKQEEFRAERQELQDREARLNAQVADREAHERELAKKELTLELRSEQVRKKMDRLTVREIELQRLMSQHKEVEEQLSVKERELQNLRAELDVREEELRRRETAVGERSQEAKKLQSELGKLEHRLRTRDEQQKRRESQVLEEEDRVRRLEASTADRELQLQAREEALGMREAELEGATESLQAQREQLDGVRRQLGEERQETERVRLVLDRRQDELLKREEQLGSRESTLRERERACQIREERLQLERKDLEVFRQQADELERRWSQKERALLDQLTAFNAEKEQLLADWRETKKRLRELEREKQDLTARLLSAEASVWEKDEQIAAMARQIENARGGGAQDTFIELDDGTKVALRRLLQDLQRQRGLLADVEERAKAIAQREQELEAMEDMVTKERDRVKELVAQQQGGQLEARRAVDEIESRARALDSRDARLQQSEADVSRRESELMERERTVREREAEAQRVATAEGAEARAVEREEELTRLATELDDRSDELARREEALQRRASELDAQAADLARSRGEIETARENLLRAREELEEVPPPTPTPRAPRRPGLARRAAEMAAAQQVEAPPKEVAPADAATRAPEPARAPLARVRCRVCGTVIPIHTRKRPIQVVCPSCGKAGELK